MRTIAIIITVSSDPMLRVRRALTQTRRIVETNAHVTKAQQTDRRAQPWSTSPLAGTSKSTCFIFGGWVLNDTVRTTSKAFQKRVAQHGAAAPVSFGRFSFALRESWGDEVNVYGQNFPRRPPEQVQPKKTAIRHHGYDIACHGTSTHSGIRETDLWIVDIMCGHWLRNYG